LQCSLLMWTTRSYIYILSNLKKKWAKKLLECLVVVAHFESTPPLHHQGLMIYFNSVDKTYYCKYHHHFLSILISLNCKRLSIYIICLLCLYGWIWMSFQKPLILLVAPLHIVDCWPLIHFVWQLVLKWWHY